MITIDRPNSVRYNVRISVVVELGQMLAANRTPTRVASIRMCAGI